MGPKVVLFLGTAGSGKTWAMARALSLDPIRPQVLLTRWADRSVLRHLPEATRIKAGGQARAEPPWGLKKERYVVEAERTLPGEMAEILGGACESLIHHSRSVLAVDEAHLLLKRGAVGRETLRVFRGSRHYGIGIYMASQRLVDIDPDLRAVISDLFVFRTASFRDLHALQSELGVDDVSALRSLPVGSYLYHRRA